ncbi:probable G-protein coupled receptor 34 [Rhopilema esculentum]|uniref:probable G-protein coupled receptor 34 n=1 Tax=Rhopilema esculentum TaxID=499914 RepID=UPI0031DA7F6F
MKEEHVAWAISIMVVGTVSVITNLIQVVICLLKRKQKTVFDVSILSLSAADMLASSMFFLQGLRRLLTKQGMVVHTVMLRFAYTGCYFSVSSSCLHIIFIAVQRLILIRQPLRSKGFFTFRRVLLAVFTIWFLSAIFACLSAFRLFPPHAMSFYIFGSGTLIVLAYSLISARFRKVSKGVADIGNRSGGSAVRNEVVIMHAFAIMLTFVICTFPYGVARFFSHSSVFYMVCDIIFALNPLLDPILYFFMSFCRHRRKTNVIRFDLEYRNCARNGGEKSTAKVTQM